MSDLKTRQKYFCGDMAADEIERLTDELKTLGCVMQQCQKDNGTQRRRIAELEAALDSQQKFVDAQAEDEGLWFIAQTVPEAYVQRGLRGCHAFIEQSIAALQEDKSD